jgi:hypothetical protein
MDATPPPETTTLANRYEANSGLHPWLGSFTPPALMTGKELRELRLSLGMTQAKFASILGLNRTTVVASEKGKPSRLVEASVYRAMGEGKLQPVEKPRDRRFWPHGI